MYHIYWIHAPHHQDPYVEGYVGISNQPNKRFRAHTTDTANVGSTLVSKYIEEHGVNSLTHTLLDSVPTLEDAQQLELKYRPNTNTGWNIRKGGGSTPDCTGREHSQETKDAISKTNIATKSSRTYVSKFKGDTERWTEEQKALIGSYHKGKEISQEHRQAITDKISGKDNPNAVSIRIRDTLDGTVHGFDTIKQAAEKLDINYPTLRAASRRGQKLVYRRWEILGAESNASA